MGFINYFDLNGERYYTGTIFIVKNVFREPTEVCFVYYDTNSCRYVFKHKEQKFFWSEHAFYRDLVRVTNRVDNTVHMPQVKQMKDVQIEGLFLGWMWYIFLMAIASIFKENIGLWCLISVIFFNWRSNKIKKGGSYIEW